MAVSAVQPTQLILVGPASSKAGALVGAEIGQLYFEDDTGLFYRKSQDGLSWVGVAGGTLLPGSGAADLGKAEDAAHTSGDVGVAVFGVQKATPADLANDGDYAVLEVSGGKLWVHDNAVVGATSDAAVSTDATGTMHQYLRGLVKLVVAKIGITIANGDDATQGAIADAAVTNPASSGSLVALLKGLLTLFTVETPFRDAAVDLTNQEMKATAGVLKHFFVKNLDNVDLYLHFYDSLTPTLTVPLITYVVPALGYAGVAGINLNFATAIHYAASTAIGGTGAVTNGLVLAAGYR